MSVKFVSAIIGCALLTSPAHAATVTFSDLAPLADVEIGGVLSVSKFDPALGTLTAVSWEINGAIASILGVVNDSTGSITGSAFTNVDFNVDAAELSLGASPDFTVSASTGDVALGVGAAALFPVSGSFMLTGSETPGAAFLAPGMIDLSFATLTSFGATGFGGDITISQATDAGISFSITYDYAVVPLPASLALLGGALGLLGLLGRRRRIAG
ncbi:choice-of-anchor E domain-containing protein [Pikeienuella piscinae]|uniref:choice-of-anchor E domain-containing protein n=1 Tax=Pikeienuella piscinae TaxID=2748098 RepID=UPI0015D3BC7B|nr:choice-of-anchor E domain-containing protein [Pikeienuella piscinae]